MKSILVPTDFSEQALFAFNLAIELAEKSGAEITLLHVADLPVASDPMGTNLHTFFSPDLIRQLEDNINEKLASFIKRAPSSIAVAPKLIWGNPFLSISRYIGDSKVDLVIMGTKGATGVRELFIGSNTEKVVRHSQSPVLAVKHETHFDDLKNIVFGNDLSFLQKDLVRHFLQLQVLLEAKTHIVRVNTPATFRRDKEVLHELEAFAKEYSMKNYTINVYNDFHEDQGLIYFAEKVGADLIALGTHGKRGFSHLFGGSIAEDIVNHARRPIWTYIIK
jgi:nucleotide-binding universal stress UspA family protein